MKLSIFNLQLNNLQSICNDPIINLQFTCHRPNQVSAVPVR